MSGCVEYSQEKGVEMKAVIIGQPNCQNCNMLKGACPDVEKVEMNPVDILNFAREVGIKSVPFVVITGDVGELQNVLKMIDKE